MTIAEKQLRKNENRLIYIFLFMYLMTMAAKTIFAAEIEEIVRVFGTDRTQTSLANLYYYVFYALMQVILVFFIDKINIKIYLGITITLSALVTISIGVVGAIGSNIIFLFVTFTLNGFLHAGLFGCSIKSFNRYLSKEYFYKGVKLISGVTIFANIISYGLSSLFVALKRWELPFIIIGSFLAFSSLFFVFSVGKIAKNIEKFRLEEEEEQHLEHHEYEKIDLGKSTKKTLIVLLCIIMLATLLGNSIHYGLNTWFTSLLKQEYGFPTEYGILLTLGISLILSCVTIFGVGFCSKRKNIYLFSMLGFAVSIIFAVALAFLYKAGIIWAIFLSMVLLNEKEHHT